MVAQGRTAVVVLIFGLVVSASAYLPIIAMHGFSYTNNAGTFHDWDDIKGWLADMHPGQVVVALDINNGIDSMKPMWGQLADIQALIETTVADNATFAGGYHFLGHSQGGLILRCILQTWSGHQVENFVSMAGIQQGIYGAYAEIDHFLPNATREAITDLFYTKLFQDSFSAADWWHDPLADNKYLTENSFLPQIDNLDPSNVTADFKTNFVKTKAMHFFGSPDDGTVVPWQSELWGFYGSSLADPIVPMGNQTVYTGDTFGLRTLADAGRVTLTAVDGIEHAQWLHNKTNFVTHILPLLV